MDRIPFDNDSVIPTVMAFSKFSKGCMALHSLGCLALYTGCCKKRFTLSVAKGRIYYIKPF